MNNQNGLTIQHRWQAYCGTQTAFLFAKTQTHIEVGVFKVNIAMLGRIFALVNTS